MDTKFFKRFTGWASAIVIAFAVTISCVYIPPPKQAKAQLASAQTWAGTATGTVNAVTIAIHNVGALGDFLAVPLNFFPSGANTGATTLTITLDSGSSLGPVVVQRPVPGAGLTAFLGGEFQSTKIATVTYDGTQFECTSCASFTPPGFEQDFSGVVIPTGWLKEDGSAISRTSFPGLFNAITFSTTANTTNTSASILVPSSTTYQVGWSVGGANVTCNATISSIPDSTHIVISVAASATGATTLTLGPNPQGDCSTTFNLPNRIGRATAMVDGSTNITATTCINSGTLGSACGFQTQTLSLAQLPTGITASGPAAGSMAFAGLKVPAINISDTMGTVPVPSTGALSSIYDASGPNWTTATTVSGTITANVTSNNTSSNPHPILMPISLVYKLIKT